MTGPAIYHGRVAAVTKRGIGYAKPFGGTERVAITRYTVRRLGLKVGAIIRFRIRRERKRLIAVGVEAKVPSSPDRKPEPPRLPMPPFFVVRIGVWPTGWR